MCALVPLFQQVIISVLLVMLASFVEFMPEVVRKLVSIIFS